MSVKQELNVLGQMRVDVPHLRSINSSVIKDFGLLLECFAATKPYILKGFTIPTNTAIGAAADTTQVVVDDAIVWIPTDINGGFLNIAVGAANQVLSTNNSKVFGSFTPNSTNYLAIRFIKPTDPSTTDLVAFYDVDSKVEFTKSVPTGLVLTYEFVITTTGFGTNVPIAKIVTNAGNVITSIENCKDALFRLGTGGDNPDINYEHTYTVNPENLLTSTSPGDPNPFEGGDWEIGTFKEWMDAVMTEIKNIKGSAYWYSDGSSAIPDVNLTDLFNDAVGSIATGRGKFMNAAGTLSWTSPVYLRSIIGPRTYIIPEQVVPMNDLQVAYITLDRNNDFQPTNTFTFTAGSPQVFSAIPILNLVVGDWIKAINDDDSEWRQIVSINPSGGGSVIALSDNYDNNRADVKALKSVGSYTVQVADPDDVPASGDTYWIAKRDDQGFASTPISDITRLANVVTVQLSAPIADLAVGQSITISNVPSDVSFEGHATISAVNSTTEIEFAQTGPDANVIGEGDLTAPAKIYLRWLGELGDGESAQFDDNIPEEVLQYIGSPSESTTAPLYNDAPTGSLYLPNFNSIPGEDLTTRLSKVTAMLADKWQDNNLTFDPGTIEFDGSLISVTGASLSIPGTGVGAGPVPITDIADVAIADNEAIYVDISRTSNSALVLSAPTDIELLTPAEQRLILVRRIGNEIHIRPNSLLQLNAGKIYDIDFVDPVSTVLPTGTSVNIDGVAGVDGDRVLFTNLVSGANQVYRLSGVGVAIAWATIPMFEGGSVNPEAGALVKVIKGDAYHNSLGLYDDAGAYWNFNDLVRHFNSAGDYYEVSSLRESTLGINTAGNVFTVPATASENFIVDYSLVRGSVKETGTIAITHNGVLASAATSSANIGVAGVTFSADISGLDLRLRYISDNSGTSPIMKYSVKRWSDLPGGPVGLPQYNVITTLPTAVVDTAYTMSNGSATEVNCLPPFLSGGKTRLTLLFTYTPNLLPGTTSGDLEVYIDGKFIPRFTAGVTVDAWYNEVDANTIEFNRDYSPVGVSLEIRRKYGAIDISSSNTARIGVLYDAIVGSSAQVTTGAATHTSLQAAINSVAAGAVILILRGSYTENVTITKNLCIEGQGYASELDGTINMNAGCIYTTLEKFKFAQATLAAGADGNIINACYFDIAPIDGGIGNQVAACVIV